MVDYLNLGYSQLTSAIALVGGFCGSATFFFLNQFIKEEIDQATRILNFLGSLFFATCFVIILFILMSNGAIFIDYYKTLPKENNVVINLSCTDKLNCSANIPSELKISCQEKICPPQITCSNMNAITNRTQNPKSSNCPPMLSIPKF
jgi:hypothetical protein